MAGRFADAVFFKIDVDELSVRLLRPWHVLLFFFSSSFVLLDLGAKSTDSAELEGGKNLSYIGYYVTIYSTN